MKTAAFFKKIKSLDSGILIFKNLSFLSISEFLSKIGMFFVVIIIARQVGADNYGKFNYALSYVTLFSIVSDLGLSTLVIREISVQKDIVENYLNNTLFLKIILSLLSFFLIFISVTFISHDHTTIDLVYILGIYTIISSINDFLRSIFRSMKRVDYEAYSKIFQSIFLLGSILFMISFSQNIIFLAIAYIFVTIITLLICIFYTYKIYGKIKPIFNKKEVLDILKITWPFAARSFFVLIYMKIDVLMLSKIQGDFVTGIYSALYNFLYALIFIPNIIVSAVYPTLSKLYFEQNISLIKKIYYYIFSFLFVAGAAQVAIVSIFSKKIITLFFGMGYITGSSVFQILSLAIFFSFISNANLVVMNSVKMERVYLYVTILSAFLNVILNIYLIPKYSMNGAAISTVIAEIAGFIVCYLYIVIRLKKINYA